ncbi:hypothetical protein [Archangium lansingense]|uniref:Lipoprotein n=1 Tax=Archangium lansingense TaxID=2995310 RepID=A0ABT4ACW2_9BACT|nr:hypothetical protein [Archangium lansinium]MCY1079176.1 hypothetical protein [Archangium lansinium]
MKRLLFALGILVMGCGGGEELPDPMSSAEQEVRNEAPERVEEIARNARAAAFCDYQLYPTLPVDQAPAVIERDRMYMAAQPGVLFKYLPLSLPTPSDPYLYSGGRYLVDTEKHAREYARWVINEYELDGVRFSERPYFVQTECTAYSIIGIKDFKDLRNKHHVMRTERFALPKGNHRGYLESRWKELVAKARARGLSSVWLVYNPDARLAAIVYTLESVGEVEPGAPDFATVSALESAPSLGASLARRGWVKTQDVTQFVWGLWFRFSPGDRGQPTLWPNAPGLPKPFSGDGLCLVSAGENHKNSPSDCLRTCGNTIADPGETSVNCPGDVRDI